MSIYPGRRPSQAWGLHHWRWVLGWDGVWGGVVHRLGDCVAGGEMREGLRQALLVRHPENMMRLQRWRTCGAISMAPRLGLEIG